MPIWEELAELINTKDSNFNIAQVDCTLHTNLCNENDVTGMPIWTVIPQIRDCSGNLDIVNKVFVNIIARKYYVSIKKQRKIKVDDIYTTFSGYPTLLYFHKNTFEPIEYKGTRDLASLTLFLSEVFTIKTEVRTHFHWI